MYRVVSWNVNSIRLRLKRLLNLLDRHQPDVVCLQEIKTDAMSFPTAALAGRGYRAFVHGQPNYNGVATLVRDPSIQSNLSLFGDNASGSRESIHQVSDVAHGFPLDPFPEEARVTSCMVGEIRVINAYVINGQARTSPEFSRKEIWMGAFRDWLHDLDSVPTIIVGDFNVAPDDRDVWDPAGLRDRIHCTREERQWYQHLLGTRHVDLLRVVNESRGVYTWWPYMRNAFERDEGLRFDLAIGNQNLTERLQNVWVDRKERSPTFGPGKASDHAPLVVDLALPQP